MVHGMSPVAYFLNASMMVGLYSSVSPKKSTNASPPRVRDEIDFVKAIWIHQQQLPFNTCLNFYLIIFRALGWKANCIMFL